MNKPTNRLASIDILRALTMLFMIFVNDLWTLNGVPEWLGHAEASEDAMGFADVIFPAFLVIVGLSIPLAIGARKKKGYTELQTTRYIVLRSFALILMGFFHVNLENFSNETIISKPIWQIMITISFFLIWLDYPTTLDRRKRIGFQILGILALLVLAMIYKGNGQNGNTTWMQPQWWGILGLIGWSYLLCSLIYLYSRSKLYLIVVGGVFFLTFNILAHTESLVAIDFIKKYIWLAGDGAMPALTMTGVLATAFYFRSSAPTYRKAYFLLVSLFSGLLILAAFATRPFWGLSKIRSTPSWIMLCSSLTLIAFMIMIFICDYQKKQHWFRIIRAGGTSTLTAYLLPYFHYAIFAMVGVQLPEIIRTGFIGIVKCLLYALMIILITEMLERKRLRLKV